MKRFFKTMVVLVMIAGWPLALSALHVVRTPGQVPLIGSMLKPEWGTMHVFTKEHMGFRETFADTRNWDLQAIADHPTLVNRMQSIGLQDALASAGSPADIDAALKGDVKPKATPAAAPTPAPAVQSKPVELVKPPQVVPSTQPTAEHKDKSIFDF